MLLRKRAWDIMREDYPRVEDGATLFEIIRALADAEGEQPTADAVLVFGPGGDFLGLVTMDDVLAVLERHVFREASLDGSQGADWDEAFRRACLGCGEMRARDMARPDEPVVRPNDPLLMVVESFLDRGRNTAVVCDGDRVLGVVLKADAFREVGREVLGGV